MALGALAVVAFFYLGTLFVLNYKDSKERDFCAPNMPAYSWTLLSGTGSRTELILCFLTTPPLPI